ncbi:hypothetical protein DUNSADRAFT_7713 [Dunaliella salina]|uniref:Uncharacterized protein n=1 Tax=Dunaliella salina TaxID=3046 RepID=A0ABQ7GKT8_DUNSA|nr:hypothetical protein DUNSADRAFT_7713 [Dunaliella salina]|eukprot:KAF5835224.1 hypothetical protein DUNSADRAFT_7713 [Dunaliella salina]
MKSLGHLNLGAAGKRCHSKCQCTTSRTPSFCPAVGSGGNNSSVAILRADVDQAAAEQQECIPPTSNLGWRAAAGVATALSLMVAAPQEGCLEAQAANLQSEVPSTSYALEPSESQSSFSGLPVLRSPPLMLVQVQPQSTTSNLWVQLGAIIAANVVVVQVGGKGVWIILEEALLELSKYQHSCKLADVAAVHMASKSEAYDLFDEVAKSEVQRARQGEADAHVEGEGDCAVDWDSTGSSRRSKLMQWLRGPEESNCDDALVVTLVVAARGDLEIPNTVGSWSDLAGVMKTLGGLSSEQLMALDLTWSPSKDNEFLTKEQLVQDYTNLKPVK